MAMKKWEASNKMSSVWSTKEANSLQNFRTRLFETEEEKIAESILGKEDNTMQFYRITPKDDLPKNLQKMNFQTLNTKENSMQGIIRVHKKQSLNQKQQIIRKRLKDSGEIMLLSEIYNYLDQPYEAQHANATNEFSSLSNVISQLDEWEKVSFKRKTLEARISKARLPIISNDESRSTTHKKQFIGKKFKLGSDYKTQVQKHLQTISYSHNNEPNLMLRYNMIQNSSKTLKKQLQEMKDIVKKEIQDKMKKLAESRKEHHRLYEEKLKLQVEGQNLDADMSKEETNAFYTTGYGYHGNIKMVFEDRKSQIQKNQAKINKIKKNIEILEEETFKNQEELKNILIAEQVYLKKSLKTGLDCRDTGLVWIIKKLKQQEPDISNIQLPEYLDKKSKVYLINKVKSEQQLQQILQQKRYFIKEVGKQGDVDTRRSLRSQKRKSSIKLEQLTKQEAVDQIKQCNESEIPKRYSRSLKKITALRQQYLKNQNLFKLTQNRGGLKFGGDMSGMTGKQIYENVSEKMRQIDFTKLKKEKGQEKKDKLFEYQAILKKIEQMHMQIEQQDIQHETHLLSQYKDQKQLFFQLAAACFGVKRTYTLIIKNFSWKNSL